MLRALGCLLVAAGTLGTHAPDPQHEDDCDNGHGTTHCCPALVVGSSDAWQTWTQSCSYHPTLHNPTVVVFAGQILKLKRDLSISSEISMYRQATKHDGSCQGFGSPNCQSGGHQERRHFTVAGVLALEHLTLTGGQGANGGSSQPNRKGGVATMSQMLALLADNIYSEYGGGAVLLLAGATGIFTFVNFEDNGSLFYGGAVQIANGAEATFESCLFARNHAEEYGGAVMVGLSMPSTAVQSKNPITNELWGAVATFISCTFEDNNIELVNTRIYAPSVYGCGSECGGALFVDAYSDITVTDSIFRRNSAFQSGGAVQIGGAGLAGAPYQGTAKFEGSIFESNSVGLDSKGRGGLITYHDSGRTMVYAKGGAVNIYGYNSEWKNCQFKSNVNKVRYSNGGSWNYAGDGAAVHMRGAFDVYNPELERTETISGLHRFISSTFEDNTAYDAAVSLEKGNYAFVDCFASGTEAFYASDSANLNRWMSGAGPNTFVSFVNPRIGTSTSVQYNLVVASSCSVHSCSDAGLMWHLCTSDSQSDPNSLLCTSDPTQPVIKDISPTVGTECSNNNGNPLHLNDCEANTAGISIKITGQGFSQTGATTQAVTIGGISCIHSSWTNTEIICIAKGVGKANSVLILAQNNKDTSSLDGQDYKMSFRAPSLTSISPLTGTVAGGIEMIILGENFGPPSTDTKVTMVLGHPPLTFSSLTHESDSKIIVSLPPLSGTTLGSNLAVSLTIGGQTYIETDLLFSYDAPTTSRLDLVNQAGGKLKIHGTNFANVSETSVSVGSNDCTNVRWISYTLLECDYLFGGSEGSSGFQVSVTVAGQEQTTTTLELNHCADVNLITKVDGSIETTISVEEGVLANYDVMLATELSGVTGTVVVHSAIKDTISDEECVLNMPSEDVVLGNTTTPIGISVSTKVKSGDMTRTCIVEHTLTSTDPCYVGVSPVIFEFSILIIPKVCVCENGTPAVDNICPSDASLMCASCNINYVLLEDNTECICQAGKFNMHSNGGTNICQNCPAGTFQMAPNQTTCNACSRGKMFTSSTTICEDCGTGRFSNFDGICEDCGNGQYNDEQRQTACKSCAAGHVPIAQIGSVGCKVDPQKALVEDEMAQLIVWNATLTDRVIDLEQALESLLEGKTTLENERDGLVGDKATLTTERDSLLEDKTTLEAEITKTNSNDQVTSPAATDASSHTSSTNTNTNTNTNTAVTKGTEVEQRNRELELERMIARRGEMIMVLASLLFFCLAVLTILCICRLARKKPVGALTIVPQQMAAPPKHIGKFGQFIDRHHKAIQKIGHHEHAVTVQKLSRVHSRRKVQKIQKNQCHAKGRLMARLKQREMKRVPAAGGASEKKMKKAKRKEERAAKRASKAEKQKKRNPPKQKTKPVQNDDDTSSPPKRSVSEI